VVVQNEKICAENVVENRFLNTRLTPKAIDFLTFRCSKIKNNIAILCATGHTFPLLAVDKRAPSPRIVGH